MDEIIAACMTYEGSPSDIEELGRYDATAHILAKNYSTETGMEELTDDILSRIWLTYRRGFPQIGDSAFTSDKGWGCMLRCGQMVLAEAMVRHHLGRQWRWTEDTTDETYLRILHQFEDHLSSVYSLHQISVTGQVDNKQVGEWYGPNTIAQVLKKLSPNDSWNKFNICVALDNILIMDEIRSSCQNGDCNWKPLVLFIPLRLGVCEINPIYFEALKKCFKMPQSLGLIGGKPNHALYFIGHVGCEVLYLDPHTTQESGTVKQKTTDEEFELDATYHCTNAQHMPFEHLDPSLALCFLSSTEKEFDDLCNRLRHDLLDTESTQILEIVTTRPDYMKDPQEHGASGSCLEDHQFDSEDEEEFEVLE